jgi:hypothetical protein
MRRLIPALAVAATLAATPAAAKENPAFVLMGIGAVRCQQFAEWYRGNPVAFENMAFVWAQGFMSGINWEHDRGHLKSLGSFTEEVQKFKLRSYCDRHPLGNVIDAVWELYNDMPLISKEQAEE